MSVLTLRKCSHSPYTDTIDYPTHNALRAANSRLADIRDTISKKNYCRSKSTYNVNRHKVPESFSERIPRCYKFLFNQRTTLKLTKYNPLESMDRIKRQAVSRGNDALDVMLEKLQDDRNYPSERPKLRSVMDNYIPRTNFFKEYELEKTEEYGKYLSKIESAQAGTILHKKKACRVLNNVENAHLNEGVSATIVKTHKEKEKYAIYRNYAKQLKANHLNDVINQNIEEKLEKQIRPYIRKMKKRYNEIKDMNNNTSNGVINGDQYQTYLNNTIDYRASVISKKAFPRLFKNIRRKVLGEIRLHREPDFNAKKKYIDDLAIKLNSKILSNTEEQVIETNKVIDVLEKGDKPEFLKDMMMLDKKMTIKKYAHAL